MAEPSAPELDALALVRARCARAGNGIYLGNGPEGPIFAPPELGTLVLGPPRSGKTSGIVVPNILAATGPVVTTSTKRDVLDETAAARARAGPCLLFDPSGTIAPPPGVQRVGWSPLLSAREWEGALDVAHAMVEAARPGGDHGEAAHWTERSRTLLSCLFHAGAIGGWSMSEVSAALNLREAADLLAALARNGGHAEVARDALVGILKTDEREQSGIWSTASSVLSAYQSPASLGSTALPPLDPAALIAGNGTLYIVAPGDRQRLAAPLVVGLVGDLRRAAYARHAQLRAGPVGNGHRPLLLVLDELANIAPLPDLASIVSEGGSQGVVTLACLQDLSQARARWPDAADGFFSLFGAKIILPGIGDTRTIESISLLAGEHDVVTTSRTTHRRWHGSQQPPSETVSARQARRLPPDAVARGRAGSALLVLGAEHSFVEQTPFHSSSPWREAASGEPVAALPGWVAGDRDLERDAVRSTAWRQTTPSRWRVPRNGSAREPLGGDVAQRERPPGPGRSR